jgi:two-component system, NarL family, response regulator
MKRPKIKILVADDHPVVRDGIAAIVEGAKDMKIVAHAGDGVEALEHIKKYSPDVVLLDLRMPRLDGLEVIERIRADRLLTKIIVLTTFESEQDVHQALTAGARGYLLKDTARQSILEVIRQVNNGSTSIPPRIGQKLMQNMNRKALTKRELAIIKLVAEGKSNKVVGAELGITEGTVKTHVKSFLGKLGARGRTGAVREAARRGLIHFA